MAIRRNYTTAAQFAEIVAANPDKRVYAIRRNVTGGNPNAQSFAIALPIAEFKTGGSLTIGSALSALFNRWRLEYVKSRFQDLPGGSEIDDSEFGDHEVASAYLIRLTPRAPEKLSEVRISSWFNDCTQLQDALQSVLAKHKLSDQQLENQVRKFLTGLQKLAKRGAVSKTLAERQHRMLSLAGIDAEDGIVERLLIGRLDEIINELDEDDDLLDMT